MKTILLGVLFISVILCTDAAGVPQVLNEGQVCAHRTDGAGLCVKMDDCPKALSDLDDFGTWPQLCRYKDFLPIVCCGGMKPEPVQTTTRRPSGTTSSPKPSKNKIGDTAKARCREYSDWLVGAAPILALDVPTNSSLGKCKIAAQTLIVNGTKAAPGEFPHMVRIGYGSGSDVRYECGGTLISNRWVMTAAHCTQNRDGFNASRARFSNYEKDPKDATNIKIIERIRHPNYKPPKIYNDIALLKLEKAVQFSNYLRPACVQVENNVDRQTAIATGWGSIAYKGPQSDSLLKVDLFMINLARCSKTYHKDNSGAKLPQGLRETSMLCAGGQDTNKDTCQGDSGGPLQIVLQEPKCMYSIIGITSFGKNCGLVPGVYTRVSSYTQWIESIVWP